MGFVNNVQAYCKFAIAIIAKMPATNCTQRFITREGWINVFDEADAAIAPPYERSRLADTDACLAYDLAQPGKGRRVEPFPLRYAHGTSQRAPTRNFLEKSYPNLPLMLASGRDSGPMLNWSDE